MSEEIHPEVQALLDEGETDMVAVLAGFGRLFDAEGTLEGLTDPELASTMLRLQDSGLITLQADEEGNPSIFLHTESPGPRPSRRERRQKRRRS